MNPDQPPEVLYTDLHDDPDVDAEDGIVRVGDRYYIPVRFLTDRIVLQGVT